MSGAQYADCAVWVIIDDAGNFVADHDEDRVDEIFTEEGFGSLATRKIKLTLRVPLPTVRVVEMAATLPEMPEGAAPVEITMTATA